MNTEKCEFAASIKIQEISPEHHLNMDRLSKIALE